MLTAECEIESSSLNRESLHTLMEHAPFGVYVVDSNFSIAFMNAEARNRAFREVRPTIGHDFNDAMCILWPPKVAAYVVKQFRQTLDTGDPFYSRDYFHLQPEVESVESYEWELHRITLPDGKFGVVCYYFDSTELRHSEQQVAADLADMRQLQHISVSLIKEENIDALFQQIVEAACSVMHSDFASVQMLVPEQSELLLLANKNFAPGSAAHWKKVRIDHLGTACGAAMSQRERVIVPDVELFEAAATTGDLEFFRLSGIRSVQSTPLTSRDGNLVGMISTQWRRVHQPSEKELRRFDVLARQAAELIEKRMAETALKASEEKYRMLGEALRDADRRKDEFLAMLAHELRNPLAAIRNAVHILRNKNASDANVQTAHAILDRQVENMTRQVDDLLDVSRVSRSKIELRKKEVELSTIVEHAVEASRSLCDKLAHELIVALPQQPMYVYGDSVRLIQIVGNLLNNACKFTDKGGRIWLTVEQEDMQAVIRVKDTGVGIAAADLSRIFELFVQVDQSLERTRDGLGLGLTLVKDIVEMHGGTVEARSQGNGFGSEFVVCLPLISNPLFQSPPPVIRNEITMQRVLVADDNLDAAITLAMLLKQMGYEVDTACDGIEAVERVTTFQPHVVLLDIGMPRLNGYEAARRIRKQTRQDLVLVALTGWGQEKDRQNSQDAGFDAHLVKPVNIEVLTKLLVERGLRGRYIDHRHS